MTESSGKQRTAVVTGASAGIGFAVAQSLALDGWRLILTGRTAERLESARGSIAQSGATVDWILVDFASLDGTRRAASEIASLTDQIDLLVNNAGGLLNDRYVTVDGLEQTFAVNHLAPFVLTMALMPLLDRSDAAHVITVSSIGHSMIPDMHWDDLQMEQDYSAFAAYAQSKLANVLFTRELARRHPAPKLVASAVHPGFVASNFPATADAVTQKAYAEATSSGQTLTSAQGADTILWLAGNRPLALPSGGYFHERARIEPSPSGQNDDNAARLWRISENLAR